MLTLYTFGPKFGLPDPSPFCVKGEVLLKLSGLAYTLDHSGFAKAPKGKLPYLDDDGRKIADGTATRVSDTTFIRMHLETVHGIDFDKGLTPAERGTAWAVEKLCEDHIYWALIDERWRDDANFAKGPSQYFEAVPALLRPLIRAKVRRDALAALRGHGFGRHKPAEIQRLTTRALQSIADVLGTKPFLMGSEPCGADATVFAFLGSCLTPYFDAPCRQIASRHANLVAYRDRGMARWYPGFGA